MHNRDNQCLKKRMSSIPNVSPDLLYNREDLALSLRSMRTTSPLPVEFLLYLTNKCNLHCSMCTQHAEYITRNKDDELPVAIWKKFIKSVAAVRPRFTLFGGEPLMYPEINEVMKTAYDLNCAVALVTNGYYLEEHLNPIINYKVSTTISIDGTKDFHNRVRNSKDSFDRILSVLSFGKKHKKLKIPDLAVNLVMLPDNLHDIVDFLEFIRKYTPQSVTLQHPQFSYSEIEELNNSCWKEHLDIDCKTKFITRKKYLFDENYVDDLRYTINQIKVNRNFRNVFFFPDLDNDNIKNYYSKTNHFHIRPDLICIKPWRRPSITSNGEVILCLEYSAGNIVNDNFFTLWNGEKAKKLRNALLHIDKFPFCTRCCDLYNPYGGGRGGISSI